MDHPLRESKKIHKIHQSYHEFIRGLPLCESGDPFSKLSTESSPFYPDLALYQEARSQVDQPLGPQLEAWLYFLLESRLMHVAEFQDAQLCHSRAHSVPALGTELQSLFHLLQGTMAGPPVQRQKMLEGVEGSCSELAGFRRAKAERLREFFQRVSLPGDEIYASSLQAGKVFEIAKDVLAKTQALALDWSEPGFLSFHQVAQGFSAAGRKGAEEGWPARLASDVLMDLLGHPKEFVHLRLKGLVLPSRRSPFSFLQAFSLLGRHARGELCATASPFIQRFDPYEYQLERWGLIFALSVSSRSFCERRLGLTRRASPLFHAALSSAWLMRLRQSAVDVVVKHASISNEEVWLQELEQCGAELYRQRLSPEFLLAHRKVERLAEAKLISLLSALQQVERYREVYDEDYLEQPRFWEEIRVEMQSLELTRYDLDLAEDRELQAREGLNHWCQWAAESRET